MARRFKRNRVLAQVFVGIFILMFVFLVYHKLYVKPEVVDIQLQKIAELENEECPYLVGDITRLDSVIAVSGDMIRRYYTVNVVKDTLNVPANYERMTMRIMKMVKLRPQFEYLREKGTSFSFVYSDVNGESIFDIQVTPQVYNYMDIEEPDSFEQVVNSAETDTAQTDTEQEESSQTEESREQAQAQ